ncbi:MAG: DNA repair protein RecO C-terminal domain-containing protein, partial [Pseudomonadota bacterium]
GSRSGNANDSKPVNAFRPASEPHKALYGHTQTVLEMMDGEFWPLAYLQWELALLEELGFGLDLTACAVTGSKDNLAYISPKSGRAVASDAAGTWEHRLFPLSPALLGKSAEPDDIQSGLRVVGHFLETRLAPTLGNKPVPEARSRLVDLLARG